MSEVMENIRVLAPFVIIPWLWLSIRMIRKPQRYFNSILLMICLFFTIFFLAGVFGQYMGIVLLIMTIMVIIALLFTPGLLIVNGIIMIRKESFAFAHILSLLLGIVIGLGEIAIIMVLKNSMYGDFDTDANKVAMIGGATVFYGSLLLLNFVVYAIFIQLLPHRANFDYLIIHGCGLADGERVTRLLAGRIDKAIKIYHKCKTKPYIIASGGQGGDEKLSEAKAITDYMLEKGIPEEHIIIEDKSATTMENLVNSKAIIDARGGGRKIGLVSSNYHIYRCLIYAKSIGMKCTGIGGKVAWYFWPTALIREFVAIARRKSFIIWSLLGYMVFMFPFIIWVKWA